MTITILMSSVGMLALLSYVLIFRPRVRRARLALFQAKLDGKVEAFKKAFPQFNYFAEQNDLRRNIIQLESAGRIAAEAEQNAKNILFPALEAPQPTESRNEVIDRIAALFKADSAIVLGTEQVIYQIASNPEFAQQIVFAKEALASHLQFAGVEVSADLHRALYDVTHNVGHTLHNLGPSLHDLFQQLHQTFAEHPKSLLNLAQNIGVLTLQPNALNAVMLVLKEMGDKEVVAAFSHAFPDTIGSVVEHWEHAATAVTEHADAAAHSIIDHVDSIPVEHPGLDFHFPILTTFFSVKREITLLANDKTTLATSVKNAGLDVVGTGVGGAAGGKFGAVIGTLIAPGFGTVIGGLIGAVSGAIGGRSLTNKAKALSLKRAHEAYLATYARMEDETANAARRAADNIKSTINTEKRRYLQNVGSVGTPRDLVKNLATMERLRVEINGSLHAVRSALNDLRNTKADRWYHYLLGVHVEGRAHGRWRQFIEITNKSIGEATAALPSKEQVNNHPIEALNALATLPTFQFGIHGETYRRLIDETSETLKSYSLQTVLWVTQAVGCYKASMKNIAYSVQAEGKSFSTVCQKWSGDVAASYNEVTRQKGALGLA